MQGDRRKAYRPIPESERDAAIAAGLAAYERGDFFEAHEDLEPAWMGTDVVAERALLQGIIKVAAAYVHDVRGNPAGIDLPELIADVELRLDDLADHPAQPTLGAPALIRLRRSQP